MLVGWLVQLTPIKSYCVHWGWNSRQDHTVEQTHVPSSTSCTALQWPLYHVQLYLLIINCSILPQAFHISTAGIRIEDVRCAALRHLLVGCVSLADEPQLQRERQLESCEADQRATSDTAALYLSSQQFYSKITVWMHRSRISLWHFNTSHTFSISHMADSNLAMYPQTDSTLYMRSVQLICMKFCW